MTRLPEPMRGDGPCMDCGTLDTPVWFTNNAIWNRVVGGPDGLLCPICFIRRTETVMTPTGWRLTPEWPVRYREAPPMSPVPGPACPYCGVSGPLHGGDLFRTGKPCRAAWDEDR